MGWTGACGRMVENCVSSGPLTEICAVKVLYGRLFSPEHFSGQIKPCKLNFTFSPANAVLTFQLFREALDDSAPGYECDDIFPCAPHCVNSLPCFSLWLCDN